jgi:hypothetical protein
MSSSRSKLVNSQAVYLITSVLSTALHKSPPILFAKVKYSLLDPSRRAQSEGAVIVVTNG